ncbi:hypothetical protein [Streptosporangium sp. NPDC051022]|uniref:hypothetical protein n=1 Tax=Streptosporangium sp. NPDC051022 TaxID=3155752 RepID=UPI003432D7CF
MRRCVALAAAVLVASVSISTAPAAAQTAPPDPARAIKRQLLAGHGVRISESTLTPRDNMPPAKRRYDINLQLGPTGPVAFDNTHRQVPVPGSGKKGKDTPPYVDDFRQYRTIAVKEGVYVSGGLYESLLPPGKTWMRVEIPHDFKIDSGFIARLLTQQTIDVFDPAVMKVMLKGATAKPVSGGFSYQGEVSWAELYKAAKKTYAPLFRGLSGVELDSRKVPWRLWTDSKGLPSRLVSTEDGSPAAQRIDTRYTGWGSPVVVTAPPADQVIDEAALTGGVPEPNERVNTPPTRSR